MKFYELESENLSGLGGAMGTEKTTINWTKLFRSEKKAKLYAEKDYEKQRNSEETPDPIVWTENEDGSFSTQDLSFVMYHVRQKTMS